MQNEVIKLIEEIITTDDSGYEVTTEESREVFCEVRSIGMKETYEALAVGLRPELTFVLADAYDYNGETVIEYNDTRYEVIRTFRVDTSSSIELVVSKRADS